MAVYFIDEAKSRPKQPKGSKNSDQGKDTIQRLEASKKEPVPQNFSVLTTKQFDKEAKQLKLLPEDIDELKIYIKTRSPIANEGDGIKKFQWTPKRMNLPTGEYRPYCIELVKFQEAYLCTIYAKKDKSDLTPPERKFLHEIAKRMRKG